MGSGSSTSSGSGNGEWSKPGTNVGYIHFYVEEKKEWYRFHGDNPDQILKFFREQLDSDKEDLIRIELQWYYILGGITAHDFIVVETTNWYWSFDKCKTGLFVQRSKDKDRVRLWDGREKRYGGVNPKVEKSSSASNYTITSVINWINDKKELHKVYHLLLENCHDFAGRLYWAYTP